jgi:acyl-CoA thioester hydrolase
MQSEPDVQSACRIDGPPSALKSDGQQSLAESAEAVTAPDLTAHLAGQIDQETGRRVHRLAVRVYYEDTDFSGVAYHASYVRWCERGRSDFLRLLGIDHRDLIAGAGGHEPAVLMVKRLVLDYRRPARIDDLLVIETCVARIGAATLDLDQTVRKADGDRPVLLTATVTIVLVSTTGRVLRLGHRVGPLLATS